MDGDKILSPLRILHVSVGLESGGAEMVLYKLVSRTDRRRFDSHVVSLTDEGPLIGFRMKAEGIPLSTLGFKRGVPHPGLVFKVSQVIRKIRPHLIQTWMYHADLVGGLAGRSAGVPVIWGLHNSNFDTQLAKRSLVRVIGINKVLSRFIPTRIVCCSRAVQDIHAGLGYDSSKLQTIPNGLDTEEFIRDSSAFPSLRQELGLGPDSPIVGYVARWDPQKDHATFLKAAAALSRRRSDVHFVLCGAGMTSANAELSRMVSEAGVAERVHLLGLRSDVPFVTAALNVATCCSSYGESFALVLGEAMACEVPVVTTNLPGPASVVGDAGSVIPVGDSAALASAWDDILGLSEQERSRRGVAARQRIVEHFSLHNMIGQYEQLYSEIANLRGRHAVEAVMPGSH